MTPEVEAVHAASEYVIVTTTTDEADEAKSLAALAVRRRLAACAQVSAPIESTYRWNGAVEKSSEYRIDFKTRSALAEQLVQALIQEHSYETPEVIIIPILGGNPEYLAWIDQETRY